MRSWVLAGCLLAAAATPVLAADLDDGSYRPRHGAYNHDYPRHPPPFHDDYDDDDDGDDGDDGYGAYSERNHAEGRRHSYDNDDNGHGNGDDNGHDNGDDDGHADNGAHSKHSGAHSPYGKTCVRSEEVRRRLIDDGWRDFHAPHPGPAEVVTLRARRPSGRLFELTLERCSGRLVYARPLERRPLRSFAPGEPFGPGRRDRYESDDPWFGPYAYRWPRRRDRED